MLIDDEGSMKKDRGGEHMKLIHAGLSVSSEENAERFFSQLLGLDPVREYTVPSEIMNDLFGIEEEVPVRLYEIGDQKFEVFIGLTPVPSVSHLCLQLEDRDGFMEKAIESGFRVYEREREGKANLVFMYDRDGNPWEIVG